MKKLLVILCFLFAAALAVGCGKGSSNYSFDLEKDEFFVEYGDEFNVPDFVCRDANGKNVSDGVTVRAYDQDDNELSVNYGIVYFPIGNNKLVFTMGGTSKSVKVVCADTLAPALTVNNFVFTAFVGDTYTIPVYKATDTSGVNTSKTAIGLYKDNETTPVATGVGGTATIETAEKYVLKIYLEDKLGNGKTYEKEIKVIDPFVDTDCADELLSKIMFDFDEGEYMRNVVAPDVKGFNAEITSDFPAANEDDGMGGSGSALKLTHTAGDTNFVYLYKGKSFVKADTFAIKIRIYAASEKISVIRLRSIANGSVMRVFDNATNFSPNKWVELEAKGTAFDTDTVDSLYMEVFGEEGAVLYIDRITIIPYIKDNDRAENVLLDYDEKEIYEAYQTTRTSNVSRIVTPGDEGYIEGAHGGYLELTPDENNHWSFHTWLFRDYLTVSEIDGIAFRLYLSKEFVQQNLVISLGFTDYNGRWINGYWFVNNMFDQTNLWHEGWNELVIKANELSFSDNGSAMSLFHGIQMSSVAEWGNGGFVCLDEIRIIPLTYMDGDVDFWTCVASFDKDEYITGEDGKAGIASAVSGTSLSISTVSGANGKALKVVSSANGEFKLNFGPNNMLTLGNYTDAMIQGGKIRVYSEGANQLLLVGYGRRDYIDSRFTLDLTSGWNEFDLNYLTNEIGQAVNVYGFNCFVKNAGTVYIDSITKVESVQARTAQDGEVVFDSNDVYSKYAIQDYAWHKWGSSINAGYIETNYAGGDYKGIAIDYTNLINQQTYFKFAIKLNKPVTQDQKIIVKVKLFEECRMFYVFDKYGNTIALGTGGEREFEFYAAELVGSGNVDYIYFALASTPNSSRIAIIREISVETMRSHNVTVTGGTASGKFFYKTRVDLTVDESAIPSGKTFWKWQVNGVDTFNNYFDMPDEDVTVVALYTTKIDEYALPSGATMINDYSTPFTPWVQPWGGCYAESATLSVYEDKPGVLAISNGNTYTSLTIANLSGMDQGARDAVNANPMAYGIVLKLWVCNNVTEISLGFGGGAAERLYGANAIEYGCWTTLYFPISSSGITTNDLFCIFNSSTAGEQLYIDQVYIAELPTYALTVNGGSAASATYHVGETVTLNVNEAAIPEGKVFGCWEVNGEIIHGNTFSMPGKATTVNAVYVVTELAIPEGAKLVTDCFTDYVINDAHPWNNPNYGGGRVGVVNQYAEAEGRAGVLAFGTSLDERAFTQWTAVVPSFDATGYTKLVVRIKIDTSKCVRAVWDDNNGQSLITEDTSNRWGEVEFDLSDLGPCYLTIATDFSGDCIWIDQIYLI